MKRRRGAAVLVAVLALAGCLRDPGGPGTRGDPLAVGVAADIGSYQIAVGPTAADADAVVVAEDVANRPPAEGRRYLLVPLRLTYRGTSVGEPWLDLDVRFVAPDGEMYGEWDADQCGTIPGSLEYVDKMTPGTTGWGTVCVAVPADRVEGGAWVVRDGGTWGWRGFFAATTDAAIGQGSFADPNPVGTASEVGDYTVSFGVMRPDAYGFIRAWDENSDAPAAGRRFVLAPVTVTFGGGTSSGEPWGDLSFTFVAADGSTFGRFEDDGCGDIPDALEYAGVQAQATPTTGNVCVSVPADRVAGGRWHVVPEGTAYVWTGHFAPS